MELEGVHILLTYRCLFECDHCFVWGSPRQTATFSLSGLLEVLDQASEVGSVRWIYLEGGEPFLHYEVMRRVAETAAHMGFDVGVVSNGYWATNVEDAWACLEPLAPHLRELSLSSDLYHSDEEMSRTTRTATTAAAALGLATEVLTIAQPGAGGQAASGCLPPGQVAVMYRGRAAVTLADRVPGVPWEELSACPHEDLADPGRVHVDPFGHVHLCQGLTLGNLFETSLTELVRSYDPTAHPIVGPLLAGGPAELIRRFGLTPRERYADACHACYEARRALRERFPAELAPDEVYGVDQPR